jgi:hypothetical protein
MPPAGSNTPHPSAVHRHLAPRGTPARKPFVAEAVSVMTRGRAGGPLWQGEAMTTLLIVDGANVVGSVPDGWWRDRRAAAVRLRDRLAGLAEAGVPGHPGPLDIVLVVEGVARGVAPVPGVRVDEAPGNGDDRIVELVASAPGRPRLVVTADRELRRRVTELGAEVTGPRTVRPAP